MYLLHHHSAHASAGRRAAATTTTLMMLLVLLCPTLSTSMPLASNPPPVAAEPAHANNNNNANANGNTLTRLLETGAFGLATSGLTYLGMRHQQNELRRDNNQLRQAVRSAGRVREGLAAELQVKTELASTMWEEVKRRGASFDHVIKHMTQATTTADEANLPAVWQPAPSLEQEVPWVLECAYTVVGVVESASSGMVTTGVVWNRALSACAKAHGLKKAPAEWRVPTGNLIRLNRPPGRPSAGAKERGAGEAVKRQMLEKKARPPTDVAKLEGAWRPGPRLATGHGEPLPALRWALQHER
ncbi:MAG: hypothetical protein M1826_007001 [Phylliscum demangeonii]|nr:MAG: hypothetical protein M1826_007001 [Phylliscum demangeonii]